MRIVAFDPGSYLEGARKDSVPVRFIEMADFSAWQEAAGARASALADTASFVAKDGTHLIIPGDDGRPESVIAAGDTADPWTFAKLAAALPAGTYALDGAPAAGAGFGWALAQYRFDRYLRDDDDRGPRVLTGFAPDTLEEACRAARATALVRDLINTPTSDMGPEALAAATRDLGDAHGATVTVIEGEALLAENFPMIHAVGRAGAEAPRLIDLTWGRADDPKVTLVGKGVCFDTGGLDLKPSSGMRLMKKDMGGAAHVLGLAQMIMRAALPLRLRVLIPAVENSVAGNAFRPGDILTSRKGLTVEIGNTDAEGRLVLADALALAVEEDPDLLMDFATLTGAARVALGPDLPPLFTDDDSFAADLLVAGVREADPLWRMPLWQPYAEGLKSPIADLNNITDGGFAGAITAALFLARFAEGARTWAHVDTFGWAPKAKPGRPVGGDAYGMRAAFRVLQARYGTS